MTYDKNDDPRLSRSSSHRKWKWIGGIAGVFVLLLIFTSLYLRTHAEPLLRARVIETLTARFHSKVELAEFHVWVADGLEASGKGLEIFGQTDPNIHEPGIQPLIAIEEFRFHTGIFNLLHSPMHVQTVRLKGLALNIPPAGQRQQMEDMGPKGAKIRIFVDRFVSEDAQLIINTSRTDKLPLEFSIGNLTMNDIGPGQPLHFDATLLNPKPVGNISSSGLFGPFQADDPRATAVKGDYSFSNANLASIKGIAGILSSTGQYAGTLGHIVVDGQTKTPDFRLSVSGHPVPLETTFHAIVDGTSGNTYLQPVNAKVLHSSFVAQGSVVRTKGIKGHEIALEVSIDHARIDDLLKLGVRTDPPLMTGDVISKTKLDIRPGEEDITARLRLKGDFQVSDAQFSNDKIQRDIDQLSLRSEGKAKLAKAGTLEDVRSNLEGVFDLRNGVLTFSQLRFHVPGTMVEMTGEYTLDGNTFDFHGKLDLDAKLSHTMTGWKSILLKPADPFFSKHGHGTEVPIKITGTRSAPHFGLDFGRNNKNTEPMALR